MVSPQRRQVLIGGLVSIAAPSFSFAFENAEKLVLSGRIVGFDGKPLAGATFAVAKERATTDADGRFMLVTDTRAYAAANARRDAEGTWRATIGLKL
ncbi:MAG: hypothetical protein QOD26_2703 [Betaproteobacteria bacterium]|jgi:protocatechuate 3,4-dioxygenase beta subunit|nr:hypothetical protein [Betaproteobacteria bacterium]